MLNVSTQNVRYIRVSLDLFSPNRVEVLENVREHSNRVSFGVRRAQVARCIILHSLEYKKLEAVRISI